MSGSKLFRSTQQTGTCKSVDNDLFPFHQPRALSGATHSKLIICNELGHIVASVRGPHTNHWTLGVDGCADRIADMLAAAKLEAAIDENVRLRALGLCLSGCERPADGERIEKAMRQRHPNCATAYVVCSDTVGTVATASAAGGLCIIAGTGSNGQLMQPNGERRRCGGWGHMLADEGSAWWLSFRAVKTLFDHWDELQRSPHAVDVVWRCVREHFAVQRREELLEHCYGRRFEKAEFAKLCERLARAAVEEQDELCGQLFADAGRCLAAMTATLCARADERLLTADGWLPVVCAGSVWNSWPLLRAGFAAELKRRVGHDVRYGLRLVRLTQLMALGAAYLAADAVGFPLPRDYAANVEVFDEFARPLSDQ